MRIQSDISARGGAKQPQADALVTMLEIVFALLGPYERLDPVARMPLSIRSVKRARVIWKIRKLKYVPPT